MEPSNRDIEREQQAYDESVRREADRLRANLPGEPYSGPCTAGCGEDVYPEKRAEAGYTTCIDCAQSEYRRGLLHR